MYSTSSALTVLFPSSRTLFRLISSATCCARSARYKNNSASGTRSSYRDEPSTVASVQSESPSETESDLITIIRSDASFEDMVLDRGLLERLEEIVSEWRYRNRLPKGMRPTNRVLMSGPPGCGKTMAANALANTLGMKMMYVRLDGLISQYMGQTGSCRWEDQGGSDGHGRVKAHPDGASAEHGPNE